MRYYDRNISALKAVFNWHATAFQVVLPKTEFWIWVIFHFVCIVIIRYGGFKHLIDKFNWSVAATMQFFMTFFVTFYNDMCMKRFFLLYPACCQLKNSVVNVVQEMSISLHPTALAAYRSTATKYLLAAIFMNYAVLTGGSVSSKMWAELTRKGLLTGDEGRMLQKIGPGHGTLVLICWALMVIRESLRHDCLWPAHQTSGEVHRHPMIAHRYNRMHGHIMELMDALDTIGHTVAMPVPYAYYHLMNIVLFANIFVLALVPALFGSWFTVFPFAMAALVVMGLREVAVALAEPFGDDEVDYPVAAFVNRVFDDSVSILESLSQPEARARLLQQVLSAKEFTPDEMRRPGDKLLLGADVADVPPSAWTQPRALASIPEGVDSAVALRASLCGDLGRELRKPSVLESEKLQATAEALQRKAVREVRKRFEEETQRVNLLRMEVSALRLERADLEVELANPELSRRGEVAVLRLEAGDELDGDMDI